MWARTELAPRSRSLGAGWIRRFAGPLIVAALIVASIAALVHNQRLRRDGLVLDRVHVTSFFTPNGDQNGDIAEIHFRVKGPDRVRVEVLDSSGRPVRLLAKARLMQDRHSRRFLWNGNDDLAVPSPAGIYTLRITILDRDRTVTPTQQIELIRTGPET